MTNTIHTIAILLAAAAAASVLAGAWLALGLA